MSDLPTAKTRPASNWSAIWVLPLIALIIGGWLGWRAYSQQGIEIQVQGTGRHNCPDNRDYWSVIFRFYKL